MSAAASNPGRGGVRALRLLGVAVAIVALLLLAREAGAVIPRFAAWVDGLGPWGPVFFVFGYALAVVGLVPGAALTLAGGAIFGLLEGTLLVFVAASLGAAGAFLVARFVARGLVEKRLAGSERFTSIDRAVGDQGLKIVFLLRLSPVFPFSLLNYALGLTRVRTRDYLLASFGMLPGTLLYVYYGKLIGDVAALAGGAAPDKGWEYYAVLTLGLAATIAVTTVVTRVARRALAEASGGTAGLVTAAGAAGVGARVALVERHMLGGDCLNVGCVPSKSLLRSAHALSELRRGAALGLRGLENAGADFAAVMERVRRIRADISPTDSARRFRDELGVDVFYGQARFTGRRCVDVEGTSLHFAKAVIASGARAILPAIEGLAEAGALTNENVFNLTELPQRLLVLGGGPIGCELAQAFRSLGSDVTIVETAQQFLRREDPDAAQTLREAFERDGIDIRLETTVSRVELAGSEKLVTLERGDKSETVAVDAILVGVGRAANVEGLGLETAGVEFSRRGVKVDDRLRTTNPHIFAAGDVCMSTRFTHAADFAARAVIQNALFFGRKKLSALTIPWCTYTQPEVAHVGLYERDAADRGIEIETFVRELRHVDRAIAEGREEGFVKIHVRKGRDEILGATVVASNAGDLISEISVAMAGRVGLSKLASVIHPYPTQAEAIRQLGDAYNRTRLTPRVKRLFARFLAFRR